MDNKNGSDIVNAEAEQESAVSRDSTVISPVLASNSPEQTASSTVDHSRFSNVLTMRKVMLHALISSCIVYALSIAAEIISYLGEGVGLHLNLFSVALFNLFELFVIFFVATGIGAGVIPLQRRHKIPNPMGYFIIYLPSLAYITYIIISWMSV